ncbi:hypothetical protein B7R22_14720 [Subtercola boreus]|uniref:HTH tetR-type domain-containing protein n=2 Tax=Subtercola boreus TaxID=120213 RepID=A0A3E0VTE6_9MICO|nr:hypothetical protein B7R22_14720 [Subtercola boreus]
MRDLVAEQGYARVTIEGIALRARVGKPTIYRWWQSKNAILAECVLSGDVLPTPVQPSSADGVRHEAGEWFRAVLEYVDDNAPLLRGLVAAAFEDGAMAEQLELHLAQPIETALEEWSGAPGVDRAVGDVSARALAQLVQGAILYRLARPTGSADDSTEEVFSTLVSWLRPAGER